MMMDVRPDVACSRAFMIPRSVMESRLEVASSKIRIGVSFKIALKATAHRQFQISSGIVWFTNLTLQ